MNLSETLRVATTHMTVLEYPDKIKRTVIGDIVDVANRVTYAGGFFDCGSKVLGILLYRASQCPLEIFE